MKLLFISLLFVPIFLFRLYYIPTYQIPESQPVKIVGRISQQPYLKGSYQIIRLGPVLVQAGRFPGYFYGERVEVIGKFQKRVINPFQAQYYSFFPAIRKVPRSDVGLSGWGLRQFLLQTRGQIEEKASRLLPEPEASLLLGVVFGAKKQMPENFLQNLRKTGTIHLVVASGQNVTLLAGFLIEIFILLISRRKAVILTLGVIFLYVLLVGAEAPAVRAGIMIGFTFLAQLFGREAEAIAGLLLAAMVMLFLSPLILFDIGFQLSFASTAGIVLLYPTLKLKIGKLPVLGEGLATTIAAQLATLPILLSNFGQISFLAPLTNALVLPTIPFIMSLGGILAILSLVVSPVAQLLAWLIWPLLNYFVKIITWFGNLPAGNWEAGKVSIWWTLGYYFILGALCLGFRQNERNPTA